MTRKQREEFAKTLPEHFDETHKQRYIVLGDVSPEKSTCIDFIRKECTKKNINREELFLAINALEEYLEFEDYDRYYDGGY